MRKGALFLAASLVLLARAARADDAAPQATVETQAPGPKCLASGENSAPNDDVASVGTGPFDVAPRVEMKSPVALGFGIGFISLGSLAMAGGMLFLATAASCDPTTNFFCPNDSLRDVGLGLMLGGTVALITGVVLSVEGSRKVPVDGSKLASQPAWRASLVPTGRGAALAVQF